MIRFSEIERYVGTGPGVYEIHTIDGIPLKVGIGSNLLKRLKDHRASRQSGLQIMLADYDRVTEPSQVTSKNSILAKHLFFDAELSGEYDLRSESGRRRFLEERCRVSFRPCETVGEAKTHEGICERSGRFRYCGDVIIRPASRRACSRGVQLPGRATSGRIAQGSASRQQGSWRVLARAPVADLGLRAAHCCGAYFDAGTAERSHMEWRDHITVDPNVMHGVACIVGTRIPVSVVLDNLAARVPEERLLAEYPSLTRDAVAAALAYAAELAREQSLALPA